MQGTNGNSTCSGDNGGPLATTSGVRTLVGVASVETCNNGISLQIFTFACCISRDVPFITLYVLSIHIGQPAIFTRVHKYSEWIDTNTK